MANGTPLRPGTRLRSHLREYTVLSTLGSGGFGITYLVEATVKIGNVTGRMKFAIKEHYVSILCERDGNSQSISYSDSASATVEKSRRAFIKEAQRVKNLGIEHPNIVPINEVFEANNTAYYVMEYLEGETLSAYVSSRGRMTFNDTIVLFRPIIDAVAVLHTNKLTHYDIKPANIILTHAEGGALRPVLIDFGLAKHYDEEGMDTSTLGTGGYSAGYSPLEQYAGLREFTPQADVYALAASMYYCLTGEKPDPAEKFSVDDMASRLRGLVPAWFIDVMKHAMAFRQADRIPNATELYNRVYKDQPADTSEHTVIYGSETTRIHPTTNTNIKRSKDTHVLEQERHIRPEDAQTNNPPKEPGSNHRHSNLAFVIMMVAAIIYILFIFLGKDKQTKISEPTLKVNPSQNTEAPSNKKPENSDSEEDVSKTSTSVEDNKSDAADTTEKEKGDNEHDETNTIFYNIGNESYIGPVRWTWGAEINPDNISGKLLLTANIAEGYHIFGMNHSDTGLVATEINLDKSEGIFYMGPIEVSEAPQNMADPIFGSIEYWEGTVTFSQPFLIEDASIITKLSGSVMYMTCKGTTCTPPQKVPFRIELEVAPDGTVTPMYLKPIEF